MIFSIFEFVGQKSCNTICDLPLCDSKGFLCFCESFQNSLSWTQKQKCEYQPRAKSKRRFSAAFDDGDIELKKRGAPPINPSILKALENFCQENSEPVPSRYVINSNLPEVNGVKQRDQVRSLIKPFNFLCDEFNAQNNLSLSPTTFTKYVKELDIFKKYVQISGQCDHCNYRKRIAMKVNKVF